jgi:hypothetical protein
MDNSDNYPVLIHCYHGTGRWNALYRIEYEKLLMKPHVKEWEHYWNLVLLMNPKGEYLKTYKTRKESGSKTNDLKVDAFFQPASINIFFFFHSARG